jgi:hypothetical protein
MFDAEVMDHEDDRQCRRQQQEVTSEGKSVDDVLDDILFLNAHQA